MGVRRGRTHAPAFLDERRQDVEAREGGPPGGHVQLALLSRRRDHRRRGAAPLIRAWRAVCPRFVRIATVGTHPGFLRRRVSGSEGGPNLIGVPPFHASQRVGSSALDENRTSGVVFTPERLGLARARAIGPPSRPSPCSNHRRRELADRQRARSIGRYADAAHVVHSRCAPPSRKMDG
jgi:hypothetical protein